LNQSINRTTRRAYTDQTNTHSTANMTPTKPLANTLPPAQRPPQPASTSTTSSTS
ncbi:hypothetical protein GE21DRAFT_1344926, partial [Neurospora crassa]